MPQPKTFREAREQLDSLEFDYAQGHEFCSDREYDNTRDELETWIASYVHDKEPLLDAAQDMYDALTALSVVSGEVLALCSSGLTVPRKVWENMISATDKAIEVCKQAKGATP